MWVSSNEVDEPRAYVQSEVSQKEKDKYQIFNTYIWNIERSYWWFYLLTYSKGDTEVKNRFLDSVGEGEGGMIWDNSIEINTLPYVN